MMIALYWVFCLFWSLDEFNALYTFCSRILSSVATEKAPEEKDDFLWVFEVDLDGFGGRGITGGGREK